MGPIEHYFVALAPAHNVSAEALKHAAAILGTDDYSLRLLLAGEMPRIVAQFANNPEAAALTKELASLGLTAISGDNTTLHQKSPDVFIAQAMQTGAKGVFFRGGHAEVKEIYTGDAFLILEGILPLPDQEPLGNKTEKKLNVPATLLMGGIPVWRKPKSVTSNTTPEEHFVRVYGPPPSAAPVEIRSGNFDYSSLGDKKGFSSAENFTTLVSELRRVFPGAIYDNHLTRYARGSLFPSISPEMLDQNIRLIYLFYIAARIDG